MASSAQATSSHANSAHQTATIDDLAAQISVLKKDLAALAGTMGEVGNAKAEAAATNVKSTADEVSEAARAKALETQMKAEDFIRAQPATALGVAAGIGFIFGLVTARR